MIGADDLRDTHEALRQLRGGPIRCCSPWLRPSAIDCRSRSFSESLDRGVSLGRIAVSAGQSPPARWRGWHADCIAHHHDEDCPWPVGLAPYPESQWLSAWMSRYAPTNGLLSSLCSALNSRHRLVARMPIPPCLVAQARRRQGAHRANNLSWKGFKQTSFPGRLVDDLPRRGADIRRSSLPSCRSQARYAAWRPF